ncbi:histidine phosphatase family protein [Intrasporangium calvum]|uniref:Histidine phosphatase family protein n=1 Tax=Intrasporangium calvum TaxID=53358 RepID=A0ABT5GD91_9MICO|nr:histidine phosphatase family protein [Intrasporangium calvum]MDC5695656.1 histidine phosphatase family protein [Intrasporangium calvum]
MAKPDGVVPGSIYLFRHGETEWSLSGQHTGTTDLPLLPEGEAAARELADILRHRRFERVLVSPLQRARHTAELAGLGDFEVEPLLREWDYGAYEGITTVEISERLGRPWEVFTDGVAPGETPGETVEEVAARAQQVIDKVWPNLERGNVALFGHGHALRVLTAVWLGENPRFGQHLILDAGSMSVLTHHRSTRCIGTYNLSPWRLLKDSTPDSTPDSTT